MAKQQKLKGNKGSRPQFVIKHGMRICKCGAASRGVPKGRYKWIYTPKIVREKTTNGQYVARLVTVNMWLCGCKRATVQFIIWVYVIPA